MWTRTVVAVATIAALAAPSLTISVNAQSRDERTIEDIRQKLLRLPYYGVFDSLAFSYEKGTVTLSGFAAQPSLKRDAQRAVKQVPRVDEVINNIEELQVSPNDDDLRWRTFYAIYSDPFLARYAPGGGLLWGHRHRMFGGPFGAGGRFPGMYPAGNYPIQIIVNRGHITLLGMVDSETDKTMAGMKARNVTGSFGVENELSVERRGT